MKNPLFDALERVKSSESLLSEAQSLTPSELSEALANIDESNHAIDEWAQALIEISAFAEKNGRKMTLKHRLDYISCCAESQRQNGSLVSLKSILEYFLNTQGVK